MFSKTSGVNGRDLRLYRLAYEVSQDQVAAAWGCSRGNIRRIEAQRRPTDESVARYLAALRQAAE